LCHGLEVYIWKRIRYLGKNEVVRGNYPLKTRAAPVNKAALKWKDINWSTQLIEITGEPIRLVIEIREEEERPILHSSSPLGDTSGVPRTQDRGTRMTSRARKAQ